MRTVVVRCGALGLGALMWLACTRVSRPGQLPRSRAVYGFQPSIAHPKLACGVRSHAGRGLTGQRTIRSKGARGFRAKYQALFAVAGGLFTLAVVSHWQPRSPRGGAAMLLRTAAGAWTCAPASIEAVPLAYIQAVPPTAAAVLMMQPQAHWWLRIDTVPPYAHVSGVAVAPLSAVTIARAVGSTCRVLIPSAGAGWALLTLPSGKLRLVSNQSYVALGGSHPQSANTFTARNAGWRRTLGFRPTVRGTVRNPNDHPHGGRTRAIKYPRTPWGKTAKMSRAPRALPRLRALAKRRPQQRERPLPYWVELSPALAQPTTPVEDAESAVGGTPDPAL